MKKLIIALLIVVIILFATLKIGSKNLYSDAPHVDYSQITDDVDGKNLYYFYQDTCAHCNNVKPKIADFYYHKPSNIDFYLVDAADDKNADAWFEGDSSNFVKPSGEIKDYSDIQIIGTPTLVEITDGKVTNFLVGEKEIPTYLESLNA